MTLLVKTMHQIKLAENLRAFMSRRGLTVTATARKVGMNTTTLHNYCNGVVPRNLLTLRDLADFFNVSLTQLVFGEGADLSSREIRIVEGRYEVIIRRIRDSRDGIDEIP